MISGETDDWFRNRNSIIMVSLSPHKSLCCLLAPQEFHQDGNGPENVGIYNLSRGVNRFCLSKPGEPGRWERGVSMALSSSLGPFAFRDDSDVAGQWPVFA